MRTGEISKEEFVALPAEEIARIVKQKGKPKLGIFVPDGNRRMTMALTGLSEDSDDFYSEYVRLFTEKFMGNLKVFFHLGLDTLMVPLISPTILNREPKYINLAVNGLLQALTQSKKWLNFYRDKDIRVRTYGNSGQLQGTGCEKGIQWVEEIKTQTSHHKKHTLFYGFLANSIEGMELVNLAVEFYQMHRRKPTYREMKEMYYGENLAEADFFIMSTKIAGAGVLPPLISNKKTEMYFLTAPGVMGLTQETYREILYDLLFCRTDGTIKKYGAHDLKDIEVLKKYYSPGESMVLGTGKRVGKFWVPNIKDL
ncbi:MAG: hypothetical protein JSV88_10750 [Candidatus Aminicenantes bacterium]|nr:MAG: hypothetical protein JSV88_10750 [Candidatus Aminicenantes bacterium]